MIHTLQVIWKTQRTDHKTIRMATQRHLHCSHFVESPSYLLICVPHRVRKARAGNASAFILLCIPSTWPGQEALNKSIERIRGKHGFLIVFLRLLLFVTYVASVLCLKSRSSQTLYPSLFSDPGCCPSPRPSTRWCFLPWQPFPAPVHACRVIEFQIRIGSGNLLSSSSFKRKF